MAYDSVTVANTATLIIGDQANRQELLVFNESQSQPVYLGMDDSVTTSNGFPLYELTQLNRAKSFGSWLGPIYGIVASGTADVRYWEVVGR